MDEWLGTFLRELGNRENVGRCVQVTLRVSAHELLVFCEGDVALDNACAHACSSPVGFLGVLRELEGCMEWPYNFLSGPSSISLTKKYGRGPGWTLIPS